MRLSSNRVLALLVLQLCTACSSPAKLVSPPTVRTAAPPQNEPAGLAYARPEAHHATPCPNVTQAEVVGRLESPSLNEASGLVASVHNVGTLWTHNDSGDGPVLYAIREDGTAQAQVALKGASARDWEDMALAPCPTSETACLYVADIGDNFRERESVQLYWAEEPNLHAARGLDFSIPARRVDIQYDDGPKDAETLLVDPISGDLYIVEKGPLLSPNAAVGVYRVARAELAQPASVARRVGTLAMGPATAGDVMADGSGIAIRNYHRLRYWPRSPQVSLEAALKADGCELPLADLAEQGEAVAFLPEGRGYVTIAEGEHAQVHLYPFAQIGEPHADAGPPSE